MDPRHGPDMWEDCDVVCAWSMRIVLIVIVASIVLLLLKYTY